MHKVSVIIPAYNMEQYISSTIWSVLSSSRYSLEIIVVNDGSTDATLLQLAQYDNPQIKIVTTKNQGVSSARNVGLEYASGEYVFFLDGDDLLVDDVFEQMIKLADSQNLDIVLSDWVLDFGTLKKTISHNNLVTDDYIKEVLLGRLIPSVCGKLIKRELFELNRVKFPLGISMGEDFYVSTMLAYYARKIGKIDGASIYYRQLDDSATNSYSAKMLEIFPAMQLIREFLETNAIFSTYLAEFTFAEYLHTYRYRVLVHPTTGREFHQEIYLVVKPKFVDFAQNEYVVNYLKNTNMIIRCLDKAYRKNYDFALKLSVTVNAVRKFVSS